VSKNCQDHNLSVKLMACQTEGGIVVNRCNKRITNKKTIGRVVVISRTVLGSLNATEGRTESWVLPLSLSKHLGPRFLRFFLSSL
jgi:hypothetical protein